MPLLSPRGFTVGQCRSFLLVALFLSRPGASAAAEGFGQDNLGYPTAAEIHVDGKFLGNRPATVMTAGSHVALVKATGFADYSRTLDVPKRSKLTLKAAFKADPE